MSGRNTAPLEATASAKAVAGNVDNLSEVVSSLDKLSQGDYALRLLLSAGTPTELRSAAPAVHRLFVDSRSPVIEGDLRQSLSLLCDVSGKSPVQCLSALVA